MGKVVASLDRNQYPSECRRDNFTARFGRDFLEVWAGGIRPFKFDEKDAEWFIETCSDWLHHRKEQKKNTRPKPGQIWKHYKGGLYRINSIMKHTETGEEMVSYCVHIVFGKAALEPFGMGYVRPLSMWHDMVEDRNGKWVPRFVLSREKIGDKDNESVD